MLQFKQGNTNITIPTSGDILVAIRFIRNRSCRLIVELGGTTIDMSTKVKRVVGLDDYMFEEFARIQENEVITND